MSYWSDYFASQAVINVTTTQGVNTMSFADLPRNPVPADSTEGNGGRGNVPDTENHPAHRRTGLTHFTRQPDSTHVVVYGNGHGELLASYWPSEAAAQEQCASIRQLSTSWENDNGTTGFDANPRVDSLAHLDYLENLIQVRAPHATSDQVAADMATVQAATLDGWITAGGDINPSSAVAIASWYQSAGTVGSVLASFASGALVDRTALLDDIGASVPAKALRWPTELELLSTFVINHGKPGTK